MSKAKQILCIDPEPSDLRIAALLNRRGIAVDLTEASYPETLRRALERPEWWDLILCDAESFDALGVLVAIGAARYALDASLVLVRSESSGFSYRDGHRLGAADLVQRDDMDHLLMVCEREIAACVQRKELRSLRQAMGLPDQTNGEPVMLATIHDLSRTAKSQLGERFPNAMKSPLSDATARIRALIDAGGLTLEFQPIISLRSSEEHRGMFETLVRLKDESGHPLLPGEFLPIVERAGWMGRVDLWILRRALATLEEMQANGAEDAVLFINVATETLRSEKTAKALAAFVAAARLAPGSVVIEVRRTVFTKAPEAMHSFARLLKSKHHGLLLEDAGLDDCDLLVEQRDLLTHIKLDYALTHGLAEGRIPHESINDLVRCAKQTGMRVIALAVDNASLLSMLFTAGVDAIQGHFVSMPYQNLMYPSIQRVESTSAPAWQGLRHGS